MKTVYMVQVARQRWRLESAAGHVIEDDLLIYSRTAAENWVRSYVSSFTPPWRYEIKEKKNAVNP